MSLRFFTNQRPPLANDIKVFTFYATAPSGERRESGGERACGPGAARSPSGGRGWSVGAIIYDPDPLNM